MFRRFTLVILSLLIAGAVHAQDFGFGLFKPVSSFTASCSQSTNFIARTSGLSNATKTIYDTLICGLVTDGVFSLLDGLYILAAPDSTTAGLNLIQNAFNLTAVGSPTFSANNGYTSAGNLSYLDTGYTPSTSGGNMLTNSATLFVYTQTADTTFNTLVGSFSNAVTNAIIFYSNSTTLVCRLNRVSGADVTATVSTQTGLVVCSRTGATAVALDQNGTNLVNGTPTSSGLPAQPIGILGSETSGDQSNARISAAGFGASLNSTQQTAVSNRVNATMTSLGINKY
jgi:hypothetical protein